MTLPLSILMPVRNEAELLPAALTSLQRQTFRDWELVAVNDGSTDATPALLDDAAHIDPRIRVLHLPPCGLVGALNAGLAACRAQLIARMDADDLCHPRRFELQLAFLHQHPEIDLVTCRVRHFPRIQLPDGMRAYETWQNQLLSHDEILRDLWVESPLVHPSVIYRRAAVEAVGGYRDCGWAEDYDLWLRLALSGARFARLPQTLFFWRDRPERFTRTSPVCTLTAFRTCKLDFLQRGFLSGIEQITLWGAGEEGKAWRLALLEVGIEVVRWIEVDRRKLGQTIHGAPVVGIEALRPHDGKTLVTIGARIARPQVRAFYAKLGMVEGEDYLCVT